VRKKLPRTKERRRGGGRAKGNNKWTEKIESPYCAWGNVRWASRKKWAKTPRNRQGKVARGKTLGQLHTDTGDTNYARGRKKRNGQEKGRGRPRKL